MNKKLGELLVEAEQITREQLETALNDHKKSEMRLGQFLIQKGFVTELQIVSVLANQLRIERYNSEKYPIDETLSGFFSSDFAQDRQVVVIRREGRLLTIAMTDPMDLGTIDSVERMTGCEVKVVICTEQELHHLMSSVFGDFAQLVNVLGTMEPIEGGDTDDAFDVNNLQDMAERAPVIELVNRILSQAVRDRASDVHISPERDSVQLRFRVDGRLHEVPAPPKGMIPAIVSRLKLMANIDIATTRIPQDGRFSIRMNHKEINIRASTLPTIYGENLVLRILDTTSGIYTLDQLGMNEAERAKTEEMIRKPYGMILSTGPTGSGKTTTLYSILKKINQPDINIVTMEDPVEFRIDKIRQAQLNRKSGMTFASWIRSILRQDPDVIMVGEIRDAETASIAVQAAMTGHRVLSTLHTNNSAGAISRFIDMGVAPFLLSSVLLLVIAQRLVRRVCLYCSEPCTPPQTVLDYWGIKSTEDARFVQARGCFNCFQSGYKDRDGIFEVLPVNEMIQEMIVKESSAYEITRAAQEAGIMKTLKQNAAEKIYQGLTTAEEAASVIMA